MMQDKMNVADIRPFVRYVHAFTLSDAVRFVNVCAYDHRLVYVAAGCGQMTIGSQTWPLSPGTLLLWPPGLTYSYLPETRQTLHLYGVNFDYTDRFRHLKRPIAPDPAAVFQADRLIGPVCFTDLGALNQPLVLERMQAAESSLIAMNREWTEQRLYFAEKTHALLRLLLIDLARRLSGAPQPDDRLVQRTDAILAYVRQHCRQPLSNGDIGRAFNFHPAYISRLVRRQTGLSLHQYLIRCRINIALNLLQSPGVRLGVVAAQAGFSDLNYFSRCFRQVVGVSPNHYRSQHTKPGQASSPAAKSGKQVNGSPGSISK
ncbi:MAG: AraC family transcriptional regulator [Clostridiaceae bacterium]|nr:AraC family transcriptional regulator [Clostridiaceae bacterium]